MALEVIRMMASRSLRIFGSGTSLTSRLVLPIHWFASTVGPSGERVRRSGRRGAGGGTGGGKAPPGDPPGGPPPPPPGSAFNGAGRRRPAGRGAPPATGGRAFPAPRPATPR